MSKPVVCPGWAGHHPGLLMAGIVMEGSFLQVASALFFAGYDYRFKFGEGGHTLAHGGSLFADSVRW